MKKEISLNNKKIKYSLKVSARARNLRLTVYPEEGLVVTAPYLMGRGIVEKFMIKKAKWIMKKLENFALTHSGQRVGNGRKQYLETKEKARDLVTRRLDYFNSSYNFQFNRISIKNHKSRWGSCSKKGNLNFNYRIALLPDHLVNYIIVHELCHLKELNHSKNFWNLVCETLPRYKEIRKELHKMRIG